MPSEQTCLQGFARSTLTEWRIFYLSLRGSETTVAIPWSKVRNICCVLFQGDRHANARDDTEIWPCYDFIASKTKYVILSVSEISHDLSEKYIYCQLFDRILHFYYKAHNATALKLSFFAFLQNDVQKNKAGGAVSAPPALFIYIPIKQMDLSKELFHRFRRNTSRPHRFRRNTNP